MLILHISCIRNKMLLTLSNVIDGRLINCLIDLVWRRKRRLHLLKWQLYLFFCLTFYYILKGFSVVNANGTLIVRLFLIRAVHFFDWLKDLRLFTHLCWSPVGLKTIGTSVACISWKTERAFLAHDKKICVSCNQSLRKRRYKIVG